MKVRSLELNDGKNKIIIAKHLPPLIIGEIGINHNGSLELAKLMCDSAARAGLKVIKHQTHFIDDEMSKLAKEVIPGNAKSSIYDIMKKCALSAADELRLKEYAESIGLIYLSTPFSRKAANFLNDINICAFKIGSGELNNYPLINHIAKFNRPMIISTGMNSFKEIDRVITITSNVDIALLHTTNLYPTPAHLIKLGAMSKMMEHYPYPVGLSDHFINLSAAKAALALGACIVEKHFTDIKDREGPDIICSMDERQAIELVNYANDIFLMKGWDKSRAREEQVTANFAFASCVAIKDIKEGEQFNESNLWVKRPGNKGLKAEYFQNILGRIAKQDIKIDTHIESYMIKDFNENISPIFLKPAEQQKSNKKMITFLTSTRADYGKIKALIKVIKESNSFDYQIYACGMHLSSLHGLTYLEILKDNFRNLYISKADLRVENNEAQIAYIIKEFSSFIRNHKSDLLIIHGDRLEALGGAIAGSITNTLMAHIEGGELSGTLDEHLRHSISKLSHIHFVSNEESKRRLEQLGEKNIFILGSPDIDIMQGKLPTLKEVKERYHINFNNFALLVFHPVTTELEELQKQIDTVVKACIESEQNYIVIYPNNDMGFEIILKAYEEFNNDHFMLVPSLKFEYFLRLLKEANFIIGNSSAGIKEAHIYATPSINIGTRQKRRYKHPLIYNVGEDKDEILTTIKAITSTNKQHIESINFFGEGNSATKFIEIISKNNFWNINLSKNFIDLM